MTNYRATTKSGAVYTLVDGWWTHNGSACGKLYDFMITTQSDKHFQDSHEPIRMPWNDIDRRDWKPNHNKPKLKRRMYLSGPSYWRISTEVVEVEVIE
jgi:hypothetical protein